MIGAMALDGFRGFITIDAGTSADVFLAFLEQNLGDSLCPGDVVVMDNLAAHKGATVVKAIRDRGADVLFTPPYSPEFNPIEKAWAKLKDLLRKSETRTREAFDNAVAAALPQITTEDIRAWTKHCGYTVNAI
jgi:transposase